ncbi:MAG: AAA family ATPase [Beijerinckiaceae bacterium]
MPTIKIFDVEKIQTIVDLAGFDPQISFGEPSPEERRLRYLSAMASDPRRGERDLLVADAAIMTELHRLEALAPNLSDVIGVIIRAATLSFLTGSPLSIPPILLLGPPGVGKSHFARRLAAALGVPFIEHAMNLSDDPGVLVGHSASWRAARAGLLADTLIEGSSASPIVFIDEIDKPLWRDHGDPLDIFHTLLEPENALSFVDAYIEAPLRADAVFYFAAANDVTCLGAPLRDRFLIINVDRPDATARNAIAQAQYAQALAASNAPLEPELSQAAVAALGEASPRQARLILGLAVASAVSAQQCRVTAADVTAAAALVSGGKKKDRMGF